MIKRQGSGQYGGMRWKRQGGLGLAIFKLNSLGTKEINGGSVYSLEAVTGESVGPESIDRYEDDVGPSSGKIAFSERAPALSGKESPRCEAGDREEDK
jgi:hypothetical protein